MTKLSQVLLLNLAIMFSNMVFANPTATDNNVSEDAVFSASVSSPASIHGWQKIASYKPNGLFEAVALLDQEGIDWDSVKGRELLCGWGLREVGTMGVTNSYTYCNS